MIVAMAVNMIHGFFFLERADDIKFGIEQLYRH